MDIKKKVGSKPLNGKGIPIPVTKKSNRGPTNKIQFNSFCSMGFRVLNEQDNRKGFGVFIYIVFCVFCWLVNL